MVGRQVLHEEEGDAFLGRDVVEDLAKGFQTAGRAADADYQQGDGRRLIFQGRGDRCVVRFGG